jgi:hypothetical protein
MELVERFSGLWEEKEPSTSGEEWAIVSNDKKTSLPQIIRKNDANDK